MIDATSIRDAVDTMRRPLLRYVLIAALFATFLFFGNERKSDISLLLRPSGVRLGVGVIVGVGLSSAEKASSASSCRIRSAVCAGDTRSSLSALGSSDETNPCVVYHVLEGRTGNKIVNYFALRLYAEVHGCASQPVASFGGDAGGEQGAIAAIASSPHAGLLPSRDEAQVIRSAAGLRNVYDEGSARALSLGVQFERADILYSAASLGWALGDGTLVGAPRAGRGPALLSDAAVASRCALWAAQREASWSETNGSSFHPWLPAGVGASFPAKI